ncbi:UDP-glucose flavonoid 3-O-glucosyltransferase 7 [Morus notabilis]|uniref:UDP-glucose flavonoid 3-O-glucosyltransferase 7 n=1 Tax=Morus notabilis TaxID=981085 RepID=W9QU29_9ROSA|nr:UDP-glucose flavonoid 3-O-glucosyltransferase 7 [Morus notabilis]
MASESSETDKLRVFFLPHFIAGHMIPMVDAARLFARHGGVTVITTAANSPIFQNSIDHDVSSGHQIRIHTLQFPSSEVGGENLNAATLAETSAAIAAAIEKLQEPLGIPRIFFNDGGYFSFCASRSVIERKPGSEDDVVLLSGLPHRIELLRSQVPDWTDLGSLLEALGESEGKTYGAIMNSFDELEPAYAAHFKKITTMKAWSVGPVSLWLNLNTENENLCNRGKIVNVDQVHEREILNWLNSKEQNSVLYVSLGSLTRFSSAQLKEISHALENSGHPFIWVVRKREKDEYSEIFHEVFEQRMKENKRGFLVRDWAPQTLILGHPATGAMVTHCGWNSVMECGAAGEADGDLAFVCGAILQCQ